VIWFRVLLFNIYFEQNSRCYEEEQRQKINRHDMAKKDRWVLLKSSFSNVLRRRLHQGKPCLHTIHRYNHS